MFPSAADCRAPTHVLDQGEERVLEISLGILQQQMDSWT